MDYKRFIKSARKTAVHHPESNSNQTDPCDLQQSDPWERCVLCGSKVHVLKTAHISERKYYIEGAGQLCENCFHDVYEKR